MIELFHFAFKDGGSTVVTLIIVYFVCQTVSNIADSFKRGGDND